MGPEEFRKRLTQGFKNIRKRGYFARQHWQCCQSCGCAAIPDGTDNYIFYHAQDAEGLKENPPGVHLAWGGDGQEIRKAFLEAGLAVTWDGTERTRPFVTVPPVEIPIPSPDEAYRDQMEHLILSSPTTSH